MMPATSTSQSHVICQQCWNVKHADRKIEGLASAVPHSCCLCGTETKSWMYFELEDGDLAKCAHRFRSEPSDKPDFFDMDEATRIALSGKHRAENA